MKNLQGILKQICTEALDFNTFCLQRFFAFLSLLTVFLKREIYELFTVISRWQPDNAKTVAIDLALLNVLWDLIHWTGGLSSKFCGAPS